MIAPADRDWESFLHLARPKVDWSLIGPVLCLDPGLTTGWARFREGQLLEAGQWATPDPAEMAFQLRNECAALEEELSPLILYEEYRVRGNKFKEHVGSEVVTIQLIGAIKVVADEYELNLAKQSAGMAKGFATDAKLRRWGLYQTGLRHANDAIRHGCYWHLFVAGRTKPVRGAGQE